MSLRTTSLVFFGAALIAIAPLAAVPTASAGPAEPGTTLHPAQAASGWLATELEAKDGMLTVSFGGPDEYADQGLTIDAVLALVAAGQGDDPAVALTQAALADQLVPYVTGFSTEAADRAANAVAKTLLLEEVTGTDVSPGYDLAADLRSLMEPDGDDAGRFSDTDLLGYGNYANGIGQALAVLALERTAGGVPAAAVEYLVDQQCSDGSFRLYQFGYVLSFDPYETVESHTCSDQAEGDPDATAFALQALLAVPATPGVAVAIDAAVDHLLDQQQPSGGFEGTGAVNSNTTGLAASALRAAGETAAADAGAAFLAGLQVGTCEELGALAYDQAGFAAGIAADRSQWTRATAQGALGLGLPAYGGIGSVAPAIAGLTSVTCAAAPAGPTITASAPSVEVGGQLTVTATGFLPGETVDATLHSTPRALGSFTAAADGSVVALVTIPADLEPGVHRIELLGRTSGVRASVSIEVTAPDDGPASLPRTGRPSGALANVGLGLVALGAALVTASHRRTRARVSQGAGRAR